VEWEKNLSSRKKRAAFWGGEAKGERGEKNKSEGEKGCGPGRGKYYDEEQKKI